MTVRRAAAGLLAAAMLLLAAPAAADAPALSATGVQVTPGGVEFFLAASDLPAGTSLDRAKVSVRAGTTTLPAVAAPVESSTAVAQRRAVVLVVDISGSMAGGRIAAARSAALDYGAGAPAGVWLGLVAVSDTAVMVMAPSTDRTAFVKAVNKLTAHGSTALYDGVDLARRTLDPHVTPNAAGFVERRIVVLSDGKDTASKIPYAALTKAMSDAPAVLDAVAFGAEADHTELAGLTAPTGGKVYPANNAVGLRAIFRTMAAGLSPPIVVRATVPPSLSGQAVTLQVVADVAGHRIVGTLPVQLKIDPSAAVAPTSFQARGAGGITPTVMAVVVAGALFGMALLLLLPVAGRSEVQQRLRQLDLFLPARKGPQDITSASPVLRAALSFSERTVSQPDRRERIEIKLDRAGSHLRAAEWQLIQFGSVVAAALLGMLIFPWWLGLPLGAVGGFVGSNFFLSFRAGKRTARFAEQLPESLQLVVGSLRSGFSLPQSFDALVREGAEPVASELGRALAETRLGGDLEDALERVGERNGSQDMRWLVMAIRIQREVGGNLSEVLETAVETMRERSRLYRHVRALSAEGRLSAMVLLGMPIVLGLWMFFFRNSYVRPLYTEPLGIAMLVGSVVMIGIGALWLSKIIKVEV